MERAQTNRHVGSLLWDKHIHASEVVGRAHVDLLKLPHARIRVRSMIAVNARRSGPDGPPVDLQLDRSLLRPSCARVELELHAQEAVRRGRPQVEVLLHHGVHLVPIVAARPAGVHHEYRAAAAAVRPSRSCPIDGPPVRSRQHVHGDLVPHRV
eukprot:4616229-Prymnesium_polylepis.3